MSKIKQIVAREVIDSRGNPTVEAEVLTEQGFFGRAISPSGASTGSKEALELRDGDSARYSGKGVRHAVNFITTEIKSSLIGLDVNDQFEIDRTLIELDGTPDKSRFGANALLALSLASCKASAKEQKKFLYEKINELCGCPEMSLPTPMMNIINGGAHADNNVDIQEFMIQPVSMGSFREALRCGVEIFHSLKFVLKESGYGTAVGDEGGFAPSLKSNEEALDLMSKAVEEAGYKLGKDVLFALDCAASEFYENGIYHIKGEGKKYNSNDFSEYLASLCRSFPISSIEDGLDEDDWSGWSYLSECLGDKVQLVGDDLFVTNADLLRKGIKEGIGNSVLVKLNQIGTLSETIETINVAKAAGYSNVISHRSGETEDTTIADLAVGSDAGQIKAGSLSRTDRVAKYNQLLRIEESLNMENSYRGRAAIKNG